MSDRGIKKWAPYKALIEQEPAIVSMNKVRSKVDKPILSEDQMEAINEILVNYQGEELIATIYKNGELITKEIIIKKIDPYERKIFLVERGSISLSDLVGLKRKF